MTARAASIVALTLLLAGCGLASPGPAGTAEPARATAEPPVTNGPSAASGTSSPEAATPPDPAGSSSPHAATPPDALLSDTTVLAVAGRLGSFCFRDTCGDAPAFPASVLPEVDAAGTEALVLTLADGSAWIRWGAAIAPASDEPGATGEPLAGSGGVRPPMAHARLPAPPPGEWVLHVALTFEEERGTAHYFWRVAGGGTNGSHDEDGGP